MARALAKVKAMIAMKAAKKAKKKVAPRRASAPAMKAMKAMKRELFMFCFSALRVAARVAQNETVV